MSTPAAWKNSAMSRLSGAEPEMKKRSRPPNSARSLLKTSLSASAYCSDSVPEGCWPFCLSWLTWRPTPSAHWKTRHLTAPPSFAPVTTLLKTFSKMRGTAATKVGRTVARFGTMRSRRPSTAVGTPMRMMAASSTLPKLWDSGSHRNCLSAGDMMPRPSMASAS
jgi:hypothetical protein